MEIYFTPFYYNMDLYFKDLSLQCHGSPFCAFDRLTLPDKMFSSGLLDLQHAQEWVVTTKLGSSDSRPGTQQPLARTCRFYAGEMLMSTFVLTAAFYGVFSVNKWSFSIFLTLQGHSFFSFLHLPMKIHTITQLLDWSENFLRYYYSFQGSNEVYWCGRYLADY